MVILHKNTFYEILKEIFNAMLSSEDARKKVTYLNHVCLIVTEMEIF